MEKYVVIKRHTERLCDFMKKVAIIMGSDSDLPIVTPAIKQLKDLGIETELCLLTVLPRLLTSFQKMQ